ncbi:hypothetical protein [Frankia sp. AgB32]|uniref:hypothetical protein n=1 Tax=Frankia sp. AgB32 TaxID=631119 RepID=UPI00200BDBED|nr:hypothetical protein [Frankia sp. AgB32]MCK9896908.1 hypothetical protein [Frankia sp. AgB32]
MSSGFGADAPGVQAGWAVYGKAAGATDDYSLLRSSRAYFSRADYDGILRRFVPGTPPPPSRRPDAAGLPWATVSYAPLRPRAQRAPASAGVPDAAAVGAGVLGIALCDWTDLADAAGRPVAETTYLCAPFPAIAAASLTYQDLHRALRRDRGVTAAIAGVAAVGRAVTGGQGTVTLGQLPGLDVDAVARLLADRETFRLAARIAALLPCQPVALLGAPVASPQPMLLDRLRFLDAVAALLPYGQRARLVVSTWADSASAHRIRLAYTDRARPGDAAVWLTGPDRAASPPMPRPAAEYFQTLLALSESRGFGVERIVEHLAEPRYRTAHRIADPRHALLRLSDLPGPTYFATRLLLPPDRSAGGRDDAPPRVPPDQGTLDAVSDAVAVLRAQRPRGRLLAGAATAETDQTALAALAAREGGPIVALELVRCAVEDDLRIAGGGHPQPGGTGTAGGTLAGPVASVVVAAHTAGWLAWLTRVPSLAAPLVPFTELLAGRPRPEGIGALLTAGQLAWGDSRYPLALVRLARLAGHARALTPALLQWLTTVAADQALSPAQRAAWAGDLGRQPVGDTAEEAGLDLVRLLLGAGPVEPLRARMAGVYWPDYRRALLNAYNELLRRYGADPRGLTMAGLVMDGLAASIEETGWPADPRTVDDALKLLAGMADRVHWISPGLRAMVTRLLGASGRSRFDRSTESWWNDLLHLYVDGRNTRGPRR